MPDDPTMIVPNSFTSLNGDTFVAAVTGGTGFIGGRLVERLVSEGHLVKVLTRSPSSHAETLACTEVFQGDLIRDLDVLDKFVSGADVLFHCAGEINDSNRMFTANVEGTKNLVCAAGGKIRHWVQLSSVGVYGTHVDGVITEETPIAPTDVYEETKAAADHIVVEAATNNSFSYTILRPSDVYGSGMRKRGLFQMISLMDRGLFFFIGKPGASANYIHVDDVVEGLVRCASMPAAASRVYNLSNYCTLEEFVSIMSQALDKPPPWLRIPENWARMFAKVSVFLPNSPLTEKRVNAMVKRAIYSSARIEAELGYRHRACMQESLQQLVKAWYGTKL